MLVDTGLYRRENLVILTVLILTEPVG